VSGVEDVVHDGVNGWFVEPRAEEITRRLRQLEADPDLRRSMGRSSREAARDFGWDRAVAAYSELYRALGNGQNASRQDASGPDASEMEAAQC
jgi:glycosyltransferase involved in cell wall biosynthesis